VSGNVHEATVLDIATLAHGVVRWRFGLVPRAPLTFRPGQFVSMRVGKDADANPILRSYSIASSPGKPEFDLILKLVEGGTASKWFADLAVGARVQFTGPMGFFVLDLSHPGDVVIGATGVGITPVLPMLEELLARPERGRVRLYWGNRDAEDLFFDAELAALAQNPRLEVRRYLTRPPSAWQGLTGRITQPILDDAPALDRPVFYLVGNGAMIKEVKAGLIAGGVDRKRQIRNEAFFD
jgi:ferredoxin-NADP reductase